MGFDFSASKYWFLFLGVAAIHFSISFAAVVDPSSHSSVQRREERGGRGGGRRERGGGSEKCSTLGEEKNVNRNCHSYLY